MPSLTGIIETCLYVADLAKSTDFYQRVFGLEKMVGDDRLTALSVADKHVLLLFLQGGTTEPIRLAGGVIPPHDGSGQTHFAFSCTAEELPKWEAHLATHNIPIESRVHWERGGESIYLRDPDQHLIEIATPGIWPIY
jgi:catechol 2,3-dioxygenase-like lactoylglutathione lyase family enzyme